jgi:RNA polymerase sigma-70 factor (ECF subfamily)
MLHDPRRHEDPDSQNEISIRKPADGARSSSSTSRTLLERVREQEPAAWERLVNLYAPLIHHWCQRWKLQPADQADIFQEVFRAVLAHIRTFRREKAGDTFRGWLKMITRNKVRDHFRRLAAEPQGEGGTEAYLRLSRHPAPREPDEVEQEVPGDSDDAADREARRALFLRALELIRGEFEERTWKAFWDTVVGSRPTSEVAEELSMSPGAVRVAKCRVLRRLRSELGDI